MAAVSAEGRPFLTFLHRTKQQQHQHQQTYGAHDSRPPRPALVPPAMAAEAVAVQPLTLLLDPGRRLPSRRANAAREKMGTPELSAGVMAAEGRSVPPGEYRGPRRRRSVGRGTPRHRSPPPARQRRGRGVVVMVARMGMVLVLLVAAVPTAIARLLQVAGYVDRAVANQYEERRGPCRYRRKDGRVCRRQAADGCQTWGLFDPRLPRVWWMSEPELSPTGLRM